MTDKEQKYNELREKIYRDMRDYELLSRPCFDEMPNGSFLAEYLAASLEGNFRLLFDMYFKDSK